MKKIIAISLTVALMLALLPNFTLATGEQAENVQIVLRPDNFSYTNGVTTGYLYPYNHSDGSDMVTNDNYLLTRYFTNGSYMYFADPAKIPDGTTKRMYADFYVPSEGEYSIWGIVKTYNANMEGERYVKIAVDSVRQSYKYCTNGADSTAAGDSTGWIWEKAPDKVSLTKGVHTIDISSVAAGAARFAGLMITNDDNCDPNTMTAAEITALGDLEKPTFADGVKILSKVDSETMKATIPEATDNRGIMKQNVKITVNGDEAQGVTVEGNVYTIPGLSEGDSVFVEVTAYDNHANTGSISESSVFTNEEIEIANIVLRPDNFSYTNGVTTGYLYKYDHSDGSDLVSNDNYLLTNYFNGGNYMYFADPANLPNGTTKRMYVDFYVPSSGGYTIWGIVKTYNDNAEGDRFVKIAVDDEIQSYRYCTNGADSSTQWIDGIGGNHTGWRWEKAPEKVSLTKGVHTIDVASVGSGLARFAGLMITNDDSCDPNKMTPEEIAAFEDLEKPAFDNADFTVENYDENSMLVTWAPARDNKEILQYNICINDTVAAQGKDVQSYVISGLNQLDRYILWIEAVDTRGNKVALAKKEIVFADINVQNSTFIGQNGAAVNTVAEAIEGKTEIEASFKLENISNTSQPILLGIAVYVKETNRMVLSERKAVTLAAGESLNDKVSAAIPEEVRKSPESYMIYAAVWDDAENIVPQSQGVLIGE